MMDNELDIRSVQQKQPLLRSYPSTHSIAAVHEYHSDPITDRSTDDYAGDSSSLVSNEATRVDDGLWITPPLRIYIPPQTREVVQSEATIRLVTPRSVRMQSDATRIEELAMSLDDGPPTPNVNDTLYLRYAIEQLTRDDDLRQTDRSATISADASSEGSYPVERVITETVAADEASVHPDPFRSRRARRAAAAARSYVASTVVEDPPRFLTPAAVEVFIPVDPLESPRYPDLTFKPAVLRLPFMIFMILFCVFMITIIMFCAIHSAEHHGLTTFTGDIYGGLYFVFRFLPQLLGGLMILCIQAIMTSVTRILPFTMMASTSHELRTAGLFQDMFSRNFIVPRYDLFSSGYPLLGACFLLFWVITILSVPLLSSLFSILEQGADVRWATVQGTAWTLVALYFLLLLGLSYIGLFFHRRVTGLIWDPRSLADIVALLPRSNSLMKYVGTETSTRLQLRSLIGYHCDRLGSWKTDNQTQGVFYCIGEVGVAAHSRTNGQKFGAMPYPERQRAGNFQNFLDHPLPKHSERKSREKRAAALYNSAIRYQYLPWFLSDIYILLWPVIGSVLLLALIIVSFLTSTNIRNGFSPDVPGNANSAGFSPAIFLYSFVPSLIGMIMFLLFQTLDMAIRILQPWKELAAVDGSPARQSLLLDYTSCHPIQCTIHALKLHHYRIATLSLLSTLFILLPILAGGVFFPLTALPSFTLLIFPNLPAFYLILTLLILYLLGLFLPIPSRDLMRLPHPVENLAEIISFLYNSPMLDDAAFRACRSKRDLETRLTVQREPEVRWAFGWFVGRNGREGLGVGRVGVGGRRGGKEFVVNREVEVSRRGRGARVSRRMRIVCGEGGNESE